MDTVPPEKRSEVMRAVKSSDTKIEVTVRSALWKRGLRFKKKSSLPGKPDIVFTGAKTVVFIDSCFWHGCPEHCRMPKTNQKYWEAKIQRNSERDSEITRQYQSMGWCAIRIWEHELRADFEKCIESVYVKIRSNYT